jgi:hypothetical protein
LSDSFVASEYRDKIFVGFLEELLKLLFFDIVVSSGHRDNNTNCDKDGGSLYPTSLPSMLHNTYD